MTDHNKKFDIYLVEYVFKLVFDMEFFPHIKTQLQYETTIFHLKRFFYIGLNILVMEDKDFHIFTR